MNNEDNSKHTTFHHSTASAAPRRNAIRWLTLTAALLFSNASFADLKITSGASCQPFLGSTSQYFRHQYNGILNLGPNPMHVNCPLTHDSADTNGNSSSYVNWQQGNTSTPIRCTLKAIAGAGRHLQTQTASSATSGWVRIPPVSTSEAAGSYTLICMLPPRAVLKTVYFNE